MALVCYLELFDPHRKCLEPERWFNSSSQLKVMQSDNELQQQLVEYLDSLPQNTQITRHKEAFHYAPAPRAVITLTTLGLFGSPAPRRRSRDKAIV